MKKKATKKYADGGTVSAFDKAKKEYEDTEKEREEKKSKSGLRFVSGFKKGGKV